MVTVAEGVGAEIVAAFTSGVVVTAWALHLGGGALFVGAIGAAPFLAQLCQFPAAALTLRFGPKRVALAAIFAAPAHEPRVLVVYGDDRRARSRPVPRCHTSGLGRASGHM